jgi:phosphomannomutase/phosphoglucomutase
LLAGLPHSTSTPEIRLDCPDDRKFDVVRRAAEFFRKNYQVIEIDGVRVRFDDGWGLVRASNTQPALVMRFEAQSAKRLEEIRSLFETKLKELGAI